MNNRIMTTETLENATHTNTAPKAVTIADVVGNTARAIKNRIISVTKDKPDRPAEGEYKDCLVTSLDVVADSENPEGEPVVLMSIVVDTGTDKFRVFYRNPFSWAKRDLPRIRGYHDNGGLKGLAAKPEVIKQWRADVQIEHNGKFTNVRIIGVGSYAPAAKAMMEKLANLMGE